MNQDVEKEVLSTIDRDTVGAIADILERVRQLPDWGTRKDGVMLEAPDGRKLEVTRHEGVEGVVVRLMPKSVG